MPPSIVSFASRLLIASAVVLGLLLPQSLPAQQAGPPPQAQPQSAPPPQGQGPPASQGQSPAPPDPHAAEERAAQGQALGFLRYLDQERYADSYAYTSTLIRSKVDRAKFASEIRKDRASAGARQSRRLMDTSYTVTLPGAPKGRYVVLQYSTAFTKKPSAVETITMSYENRYWRVAGWYLK